MRVFFYFESDEECKNVTTFPRELTEAYQAAKQAKIIWALSSVFMFLFFGSLLAAYLLGYVSWTGTSNLEYLILGITCASLMSLIFSLIWELPSAYLLYGCMMTDGFVAYVVSYEQALLYMAALENKLVTIRGKRYKKALFKQIDSAETLLGLNEDIEEAEDLKEVLNLIAKRLPLKGFKMGIDKEEL